MQSPCFQVKENCSGHHFIDFFLCLPRCFHSIEAQDATETVIYKGFTARWFSASSHYEEILASAASFTRERTLHVVDAFGASQGMATLG